MSDFKVFIERLMKGANNVYFRDVISAATHNRIVRADTNAKRLLLPLKDHFRRNLRGLSLNVKTRFTGRANELSNHMESVVIREINRIPNFKASKPIVKGKGRQAAGYPDIFIQTKGREFYLEVKTFQTKTKDSSLRTFYYKPSERTKITKSCPHLLIAFEVESLGTENRSPFVIKGFKIVDLYDLKVSLKPEFNANNIEVYKCSQI